MDPTKGKQAYVSDVGGSQVALPNHGFGGINIEDFSTKFVLGISESNTVPGTAVVSWTYESIPDQVWNMKENNPH